MFTRILAPALAIAMFAGAAAPAPVLAEAGSVSLKGEVKLVRQVVKDGKTTETLEEPGQVLPGDRLLFATRYTNSGAEPATDLVVVNPLPQPVRLATAEGLDVSVDGGKTFGLLAALKIADRTGAARAAELGDVTHVRWRIASIAPGSSGEVRYLGEVR
ncbi:hypothetical protein [Qipengyuania sediminis]|uniref:hypothetical protein n=1 Tax=Qipengyuania sediminis TaxID=1532023 RepID=UPI00105AAEA8|nr:hypothetical protein [Qipengyuania sediminis]